MVTVPVPGVAKDQVNEPVGVELPSATVAVQVVILPTGTVLGEQETEVVVGAAVNDIKSDPELLAKSEVPAKDADMVVDPLPTVNPVTVTVQELVVHVSEEIDTVPVPGVPKDQMKSPVGVEPPSVTVAVQDVVAPTATVLGEQVTDVLVVT